MSMRVYLTEKHFVDIIVPRNSSIQSVKKEIVHRGHAQAVDEFVLVDRFYSTKRNSPDRIRGDDVFEVNLILLPPGKEHFENCI